jgi:hypothetical protein
MQTLEVTQEDLDEFKYTSKRNNKILKYWRSVVKNMPGKLQTEVKMKPTTLEKVWSSENQYKFYTLGASTELNEYLSQFNVILEDPKENFLVRDRGSIIYAMK